MALFRSLTGDRPRSPDLTPPEVRDEFARDMQRSRIILAALDRSIDVQTQRRPLTAPERRKVPR